MGYAIMLPYCRLMGNTKEIGHLVQIDTVYYIELNKEVFDSKQFPTFVYDRKTPFVPMLSVIRWAKIRVMPENRMGIEDLLLQLNLEQYDAWEIAKQTRASCFRDDWWLKFSETDDFYKDTTVGRSCRKLNVSTWFELMRKIGEMNNNEW